MTLANSNHRTHNIIISNLFFKLLPVQILIVAMGAVNSIVDGAFAGRCIDAGTVGVVGLYCSMIRILEAVGAVLLGGTAVLCGHSMGSGDLKKTRGIFSLNLTLTLIIGVAITLFSFAFSGTLADILGANAELKSDLQIYIRGYAVGIIPQLLAQQIAAFLQMERKSGRGYAGIAGMIVANILLDYILVAVLKWGIWGLALATALSNWVYFLILSPYYLTKQAQLKYSLNAVDTKSLWPMIKIGIPGASLVFCLAIRGIVLNRILLEYSGKDGLSALAAFNMISGIFIAFALGVGAVVRMLGSVFIGEEDRDSIKELIRIAVVKMLPISIGVMAIVMLLSVPVSSLFFPDKASEVFRLTRQLFFIYACCIPLIVLCQVFTNYLQAFGHNLYVNILSVFDGFFAAVIPAWILAPKLGAFGVWLSNPIGILLTLLLTLGYAFVFWKGLPGSLEEWLFMKPSFGVSDSDRLDINITHIEEVSTTAERVQEFCNAHGINDKTAYYSALCLEEMAGNVVEHGFEKDNKHHNVNARVICKDDSILLRLKDDCIPFNPKERAEVLTDEDPTKNMGIRIVYKLADEVTYQNMLGLNVLTIKMNKA